jgi:thiamine-monophosphate kinase
MNLVAAIAQCSCLNGQFDVNITQRDWQRWALSGGDDYELLFTAPVAHRAAVAQAAAQSHTPVTRIGHIEADLGLRLVDAHGQPMRNDFASFDHFA